jgi:hypothetical protein
MTKSPKKIDSDGDDLWSLLWSRGSNCFHIEELLDTCAKGRRFLHLNQRNDYLLIGVGTFDQMNALADRFCPYLLEREQSRKAQRAIDVLGGTP